MKKIAKPFLSKLTRLTKWKKDRKFNRNGALKVLSILLIVAAIGTAWALTLFSGRINMNDPVAVAEQFIIELQANHSHAAYTLTSPTYHQNIKESDFTNDVATDVIQQMPQSKPQLFSTALPPKNSKATGQERVLINIPHDNHADDHEMAIVMIQDTHSAQKDAWYVQSFTLVAGKAVKH